MVLDGESRRLVLLCLCRYPLRIEKPPVEVILIGEEIKSSADPILCPRGASQLEHEDDEMRVISRRKECLVSSPERSKPCIMTEVLTVKG